MKLNFLVQAIALSGVLMAQPVSVLLNPNPSRILGHARRELVTGSPNYVEGREMTTPQGIAVDNSVSPPILYVADTGNNRVLAWRNPVNAASGAPADLVIGQRDRFQTTVNGPGTNFTTGLNQPTGLAVDTSGNLYVVDTNNNRIVRYPKPFDQPSDQLLEIDLILGQETFGSATGGTVGRQPNRGRGVPAANSFFFSDLGSNVFRIRITFDGTGNLWVTDSGNNRVVRYPASRLTPGNFGVDGDVFLGQLNGISNTQASDARDKSGLAFPSGITWSSDGRLYVSDARGRVLVFRNPSSTGQAAERLLGIAVVQQGQPLPPINDLALGSPEAVFVVNNSPYVVDARHHRIVRYDTPDAWPAETTAAISPRMRDVIGQGDFNSADANRGLRVPSALGLNSPVDAVPVGSNLFVVDANNHRVIMIAGGAPFNTAATKVLGQQALDLNAPNLVEGREFFFVGTFQNRTYRGGGIALDGNTLYIADTLNNRVLGYRDVRSVALGQRADLVIGQEGFERTTINSPTGNQNVPNASGLFLPHSVAVDSRGDLYVADTLNSRVLRFPRPFDNQQNLRPNLVLGQSSFTSRIQDASPRNMSSPVGLAFTTGGHLVVSDNAHNRVLLFLRPENGDFTNGQAAAAVFGQADFVTTAASNDPKRMNNPRGITVDVDDRLYVVDAGNSRLHIYNRITQAGNDPTPALTLTGFNNPIGTHSDPRTAELWITDGNNNRALRFPAYESLSVNARSNLAVGAFIPLDLKVDANSNLIVTDTANRIAFYYQAQVSVNGANQQTLNLSPGMIASTYAQGGRFADEVVVASTPSLPTELGDIQLLVNDVPAPLFFVSPNQINYQVPWGTRTGADADVTIIKKSTGQVLASSNTRIDVVSPGFFTATANGRGQISALNQDNSVNSISNPVARGQVIQLYGTGIGPVSNQPGDGQPSPSSPLAVGERPDVIINGRPVAAGDIQFSGLAPGFVGLWQLNVRIPDTVPPGNNISVLVLLRSVPSQAPPVNTVISVRQ